MLGNEFLSAFWWIGVWGAFDYLIRKYTKDEDTHGKIYIAVAIVTTFIMIQKQQV